MLKERSGKRIPTLINLFGGEIMKEEVAKLVDDDIKSLNVFVSDVFVSSEGGKKIFNIV